MKNLDVGVNPAKQWLQGMGAVPGLLVGMCQQMG